MKSKVWLGLALLPASTIAMANSYSYGEIAKRYPGQQLEEAAMEQLKIQAECLVGIKKLNFKRKDTFDPIAEWTSFRTRPLLEKYTPCETLVILAIAQKRLKNEK